MTEWDAISDFLKEHGREEWGEMVARLTGKVYVLWDRPEFVGVFSTREAAERHDPDGYVEEVLIDDLLAWEVGPVYTAAIDMGTGEISNIRQLKGEENRHPTRCHVVDQVNGSGQGRIITYSPISTAHAMQAAMDRRAEIRAETLFSEDSPRIVPDRIASDPWTAHANATPLEDIRRFREQMRGRHDDGHWPDGTPLP